MFPCRFLTQSNSKTNNPTDLRSGLWAGHGTEHWRLMTLLLINFSLRNAKALFVQWLGAPSCWNQSFFLAVGMRTAGNTVSSRRSRYLSLLTLTCYPSSSNQWVGKILPFTNPTHDLFLTLLIRQLIKVHVSFTPVVSILSVFLRCQTKHNMNFFQTKHFVIFFIRKNNTLRVNAIFNFQNCRRIS